MSIKEAMTRYFSMRREMADGGLDFLFKTPFIGDVHSLIYVGDLDEEGYISWKPVEKEDFYDFKELEGDLGCKIHPSVIEYFNSYWFTDLEGFIKDYTINLESVLPNTYIESYSNLVRGYMSNHKNRLENIPLGVEGDGLIVVVDNEDGSVKLEDFETGSFEVISESVERLISALRLKR